MSTTPHRVAQPNQGTYDGEINRRSDAEPGEGPLASPRVRWLVLAGAISPYFAQLWSRVAALPGHSVTLVHQLRRTFSSFEHEAGTKAPDNVRMLAIGRGLDALGTARELFKSAAPDVIVCAGHVSPHAVIGSALGKVLTRSRVVYMGDTNGLELAERGVSSPLELAKLAGKRWVLGGIFDTSFVLGWSNALASRAYRIPHEFMPLYTVDFAALEAHLDHPFDWAEGLARPRLVCVSRLVDDKNLGVLVEAWRRTISGGTPGSLIIVGDGPGRDALSAASASIPATRFRLAGSVPRDEMGRTFAVADAVLLPSKREPWGIVVTEALGLGIPVLASDQAGAAVSLAQMAVGALQVTLPGLDDLASSIARFVRELPQHAEQAERVKAEVRDAYDREAVAMRLGEWANRWVRR